MDEAVARDEPDLLLVDATFPGVGDDDLVAILLRHVATRPVVLFSDRGESEIRALVARTGARGFVPKEGPTLLARLSPYLEAK
jgi:DNA-binding NarL/FixJ family response regulator